MKLDVGTVRIAAKEVNVQDAWAAIGAHGDARWGDVSPNQKFMNDQNVLWKKEPVVSRHIDRNGVRFKITTDFKSRTTTLSLEGW